MLVEIKMPDLATTENEVTILRWLVEVGGSVKVGQPLFEIETDKATMEVEAVASGQLKEVRAPAGSRTPVGSVIAIIDGESASVPTSRVAEPALVIRPAQPAYPPRPAEEAPSSRTSLFARNKAARQRSSDRIPLSPIQREVARRMTHSKQTIPHFYLTASANAERLAAIRAESNNAILWDALFVKAAARALVSFDRMAYRIEDNVLVRRATNAIGVAIDLEGDLFVVPVENPLTASLAEISTRISARVERLRQGDPEAKRLAETIMTVTNLGAEHVESFLAILNPPESAVLAVGQVAPTVYAQDNQAVIQKRVSLSLSVDHRVANGKYAAAFLSKIVSELESLSQNTSG